MFGLRNLIINSVKRGLDFTNNITIHNFSTFNPPLCMQVTQVLMAMPMKKKKKLDPVLQKARDERKRKRLYKEIKRLMKIQKQLKPLDELEIPYHLVDEPKKYERKRTVLSAEILEQRGDLLRMWNAHKTRLHMADLQMIDRLETAQNRALLELEKASPELYQQAIQIDETLLPFTAQGPTLTPPIKDYDSPDGDYVDVTKTWDPPKIPEMDKKTKAIRMQKIYEERERLRKQKESKE